MRTTRFSAINSLGALAVAGALLMAGCASTSPQYYSLAESAPAFRSVAAPGAGSAYIELAPVAMPERFARPQMVVRKKGAAEGAAVDILEDHRWASSFESELRDALGIGIAGRLGAVDATRLARPPGQPAVRIAVQLRQFEAVEGGSVDASFSWTVRGTDEGRSTACQLSLSEPVAAGFDALALGAQRLTARLSDAIARSASALQAGQAPACAS